MLTMDQNLFLMREGARLRAKVADQVATSVSIYEISDQYGISLRTLRRKQAAGQMPSRIKLGQKLVYRRDAIERLFQTSPAERLS